ncbi:MAG: T9SS type A sorting domain-containing protein, partial [Bacteroidales bacterium]
SFDQNSESLLWVGIDTSFNSKMIVFNTKTNTYEAGFVPGSVSEIVCDNFEFAQNAYPVTAIQDNNRKSFSIYPNPASKKITLQTDGLDNAGIVKIYSMNGVLCLSDEINTLNKEINIESLDPGMYVLTVQISAEIQTKRLVIQ